MNLENSPHSPLTHTEIVTLPLQEQPVTPERRKRTGVGLVATALIAALIGGGVAGAVASNDNPSSQTQTSITSAAQIDSPAASTVSGEEDISGIISKSIKSIVTVSVITGEASGTGSGVILDDQGYIVTNAHVATVAGASETGIITIQTNTGDIYDATLVAYDSTSDLAVLKVEGDMEGTEPIAFASSEDLQVGDSTIAIGSPLGLSGTVTTGVVSALDRTISVESSEVNSAARRAETAPTTVPLNVIQTDAAINSGNSGGALLDGNGNLIGINVAIASTGENAGSIGVGFAIPSDYVKRITSELVADGEAVHGFFGANISDYQQRNTAFTSGAQIASVQEGSPAAEAGFEQGDVITEVNGTRIESATQFSSLVKQQDPYSEASIDFTRNGVEQTADVTLGEVL